MRGVQGGLGGTHAACGQSAGLGRGALLDWTCCNLLLFRLICFFFYFVFVVFFSFVFPFLHIRSLLSHFFSCSFRVYYLPSFLGIQTFLHSFLLLGAASILLVLNFPLFVRTSYSIQAILRSLDVSLPPSHSTVECGSQYIGLQPAATAAAAQVLPVKGAAS